MNLYKYFSVNEYSLKNLCDRSLWFSGYSDFNDPFEGKFTFVQNYDLNEVSYEQVKLCLIEFIRDPSLSGKNKEYINQLSKLGKEEEVIACMFNQFKAAIEESLNNMLGSDGVSCFSKGKEKCGLNQLMWSHYADGLRGFCLVFDEQNLESSFIQMNDLDEIYFLPIKYTKRFPIIDLLKFVLHYYDLDAEVERQAEEYMHNVYGDYAISKSNEWKYEREYRAISKNKGIHYYSKSCLSKIMIGEKISHENRKKIFSILNNSGLNIDVVEVGIDCDGYNLLLKNS